MDFKRADDVLWVHLAQARDLWRALVNMVKIFGFHRMFGNFLKSCMAVNVSAPWSFTSYTCSLNRFYVVSIQ
jgi:hypothetical protein